MSSKGRPTKSHSHHPTDAAAATATGDADARDGAESMSVAEEPAMNGGDDAADGGDSAAALAERSPSCSVQDMASHARDKEVEDVEGK